MSILGITHDREGRLIQRLAVDVKLAIGLPPDPAKGRKAPTKLDQFIFLRKPEEAKQGTDWKIDDELTKHYGPKPREVEVIFLSDDIEEVFPTQLAWWKASHCVCFGDGEHATRRTEKAPDGESWAPCGNECPDFQRGDCKPSGDLRFTLAAFPQLGAVARIHTSSYRSIMQISSALHQVQTITGGRLAGIRAKLVVRPEKTSYLSPKDQQRHSTTIYALSIEIQASGMRKLIEGMTDTARLFEQTRKALGTGHVQVVEDEGPRAEELSKEFYSQDEGETLESSRRTVLRNLSDFDVETVAPAEDKPFPSVKCNECQAEGGHLPSCSQRKEKKAKPAVKEPAPPVEKEMCSECRTINGHTPDCKFYKAPALAAALEPSQAAVVKALYSVTKVEQKNKKAKKAGETGEPFLSLSVVGKNQAGEERAGKIYIWHKHLHEPLLGAVDKRLLCEVSQQKQGDQTYIAVEHILELGGIEFQNDKPKQVLEPDLFNEEPSDDF